MVLLVFILVVVSRLVVNFSNVVWLNRGMVNFLEKGGMWVGLFWFVVGYLNLICDSCSFEFVVMVGWKFSWGEMWVKLIIWNIGILVMMLVFILVNSFCYSLVCLLLVVVLVFVIILFMVGLLIIECVFFEFYFI